MVTLLEVSEREEGVVALHLPTGPLKKNISASLNKTLKNQLVLGWILY